MDVIGEVEVRIIEGNCVDRLKPWREVGTTKKENGEENYCHCTALFLYLYLYVIIP